MWESVSFFCKKEPLGDLDISPAYVRMVQTTTLQFSFSNAAAKILSTTRVGCELPIATKCKPECSVSLLEKQLNFVTRAITCKAFNR